MANPCLDRVNELHRRQRADARQYRLVICLTFAFYLLAVALRRLFGRRDASSGWPRQSIFAEARDIANSTIPFAFM